MAAKDSPWYVPHTLCEVCANACGGCSWSEKNIQTPVEGWEAVRNDISVNDKTKGSYREGICESYVVLACPQFELEEQHRWAYERFDPEKARRHAENRASVSSIMKKLTAKNGG